MKRSNQGLFLFFFVLLPGVIASLITFGLIPERSVNFVQKTQAETNFDSVEYSSDVEQLIARKSEPTEMQSREMSLQTKPKSKKLFDTDNFSLIPKIEDTVKRMLMSAAENSKFEKERESESDEPDGAAKFRRLQMQDEKGEIPLDGLQKAREQMDKMRAFYRQQVRAAGKPDGIEIAGLAPGDWRWLGPGNIGGRIRSIVIDPNNPLNIWAGSVAGGIWKSTNAGNSWQPVNDFMANLAVTSLIIHPSNRNIMYAATGEGFGNADAIRGGGIFQSTDSGNTWNVVASTNPAAPNPPGCGVGSVPCSAFWTYINRLAIASNGTLLAATNNGIARSINGGASWTQQTAVAAMDIDFDPNNSSNVIVGELTQCPAPPGPPCPGSVQFSTDGGVNWNPATFNPPITNGGTNATDGRVELAYAPSSSNIVYASVNQSQGVVYRSTNFGQNFNQVNTTTNLLGTVGWYANALWVNPRDPTFLLVGGVNLYQSGDSGVTFAIKANGSSSLSASHADHHVIIANPTFDDTADKSVYFGNDGGVFRVDDIRNFSQTSGWTERNNNLGITQFYGGAVTPNGVIFGGTQDNGTIKVSPTPNVDPPYDTENWVEFFGSDGGYVAADPTDSNYLYGETQNMGLVRSTNGGGSASFIYCNNPPNPTTGGVCPGAGISDAFNGTNFISPFLLDPSDPNTMLAGGLSLWQSNDVKTAANPSWTAIKPPNPIPQPPPNPALPNPISAIAVSPSASSFIVVGHNNGAIFMTTSGGLAWNQINTPPAPPGTPPTPQRLVTRLAIDNTRTPNWIYATFGGFANNNVFVTRDLGATWIDVSGVTGSATDLPAVPVRSILINPANNNFLYVGTEVGIFASQDAGATWQLPNGGPANVSVDELFFNQGDLMAATHGRGVYTTRAPVIDLPVCTGPPSDGICPFPATFCPISNSCCVVGNWECACTWNNGRVPTVNDDVAVYCPITVNSNATARNLRVDGRLSLNGGSVNAQGDIINFGLIESVGGFSSNITGNNLLNVRPEHAVTLKGIISLTFPSTIRGGIANYGIINGAGIDLNGPIGAIQQISGTGQWNNNYLRIWRTAYLDSDVTLNSGSVLIQQFARLRLTDRTLTVNSSGFTNSGTVDVGTGTFNFNGSQFQSVYPNNGDTLFGFKGTGNVNLASGGNADLAVIGGPGTFQPSLRVQSGTVNANFGGFLDGTFAIDSGATFNLNDGGGMTLNGDANINGTFSKTSQFTTSVLNFNGANFTNNGTVFVDFLNFNTTGTPKTHTLAGTGGWSGTSVGSSNGTTLMLANDMTFNQSQFGVPTGSILNLGNFTLTYTGANMFVSGRVIGTGTFRMQPSGNASLTGTGNDPFAVGVRIASGTVAPSLRVSGAFTIDAGATLNGGSLTFFGNTFTNNGAVVSSFLSFDGLNFQPVNQQLGGTGTFTGSSGQLFIASRSTTTLLNDITYTGSRIYNENRVNTGTFTLTLPCPTGSEGPGEIIGNVRRTNLAACPGPIAFGNPFTTIQFTSGIPPTEISVNVALNPPAGFPNAVRRTYFITPIGGSNYTANLRLHYLDSELNGNDEATLQLFRNDGTSWMAQGATNRNSTDNWVEYSGVTQFSPWAIAPVAPTAAQVSVGGRVFSGSGQGVVNALVTLTNTAGEIRSVRTNSFGYYRLDGVAVGENYVIGIKSKQYNFNPQIVSVTDEITDLNFIAQP